MSGGHFPRPAHRVVTGAAARSGRTGARRPRAEAAIGVRPGGASRRRAVSPGGARRSNSTNAATTGGTPARRQGRRRSPSTATAKRMPSNGSTLPAMVARTGPMQRNAARRANKPAVTPRPAAAKPRHPAAPDGEAQASAAGVARANTTAVTPVT